MDKRMDVISRINVFEIFIQRFLDDRKQLMIWAK